MDEQEYLEPGFDPASLTIPRLRSILVAHDVHYPASAKKSQLIEIFNDKVASQARKLRAANARVKRTSRGIENVSPVKDEESEDEVADLHRLRQTRTPARTPRRTTRARTEEVEELPPPSRNTRHSTAPPESTPRQPTIKHAHTLEELSEPEPKRPASRKTRPSVATPALKQEHEEDDSPFSNDNVFQTGSSPLAPPSTGRRRTTLGVRDSSRSRTRENRRKTDDLRQFAPQNDGAIVPTRRTFDIPLQKIKQEEDIEPTEEFTPEEQQALVAHQQSGAVVPARQKRKSASSSVAKTGIGSILTVLLATAGYLWSEEKFKVGYCGVGQPSTEIRGVEIPEWADSVRPPCEPCPPHAYCHDNLKTVCEQGFILTPHPLSLGGLLPLPPTCEADSARARRVKAVKDRAVEELREQNAKYECGEAVQPELKETELKRAIATYRRKDMSNDEFEDLWASALGELQAVEEITSGSDGIGNSILRSTSLARVPISCAIRRSLLETIRRYVWSLIMLAMLASSGVYGRHKITSSKFEESKAKELASLAMRKLSDQASLHAVEPDRWEEGFISVAQLRDDVLRDEFSASRRKKIWDKVQKKVEGNANVRRTGRVLRSGDVGPAWEWVGAIGAIESSPYDRRRSGGYHDSIAGERLITPGSAEQPSTGKLVRWAEQGQYY